MDAHGPVGPGRRAVTGEEHGVHEHSVVLQAHVARVHREAHQGLGGLRGPYLQHGAEREAALVSQGPARFGVQVGEVFQQQGAQRASEAGCGAGEQLVQIRGAGDRAVRRIEAQRPLECAVLRA